MTPHAMQSARVTITASTVPSSAPAHRHDTMWVGTKHKFIHFVHEIALLDHWNRLGESFPTMYGSGGCLWLAGYANRM